MSLHHHWTPDNQIEMLLVDELAATQWKLLRAESIETATLNSEMDILLPEVEKAFKKIDEPTRQALAFKSLADHSKTLAALERHQTRLHRQFQRTWKHLSEMKKSSTTPSEIAPVEATQPEPIPASTKDAATPIRHNPTHSDTTERNPASTLDQPSQYQKDETPPCRAA